VRAPTLPAASLTDRARRLKLLLPGGDAADSGQLIRGPAADSGVLALPGTVFLPNGAKTPYVRAAFSLLGEEDVDEALRRLRTVVLKAREGQWVSDRAL
jgi:tryptophan aminotransferase